MPLSPSECGRMSKLKRQENEAAFKKFLEEYRPKIIERHTKFGYPYTRYEAACAEGGDYQPVCKPTGRSGGRTL